MKKVTRIEPVPVTVKKKLKVAAYCRVSTGMEEQLLSLEVQKAHYEEYIKANPEWEYSGLYYDEGITGTQKEKRSGLQRMIRDCEDGKIDYILTKSLSRFARNTADCLELVRKLLELGISIYFEKENLDTGSMESELLLTIMSSIAESESVSNSENNRWGVRHRFENGTYKLGCVPYGYRVKDGVFSICEEEAKWVRYMFKLALNGKSTNRIAGLLNAKKVPARRSDRWHSSTVRGILLNEKYTGNCMFQKTYKDFRFKRYMNYGERDQFYVEGHHEPIVTHETFEEVAKVLENRRKRKDCPRGVLQYPFSGKIICGGCGTTFIRGSGSTSTFKYPIWVCRKHILHIKDCPMLSVREEDLEAAFATMMNKLVFAGKEILGGLLDAVLHQMNKDNLLRVNEIDGELDAIEMRRQDLTAIMAKGYLDPATYTREVNELYVQIAGLEEEREGLTTGFYGDRDKLKSLRELLRFTGKGEMLSGFDPEVFERFVDQIIVFSREEVEFHLKCGLCLRERIG